MSDLISRFISRSDLHQSPMHANLMKEIGWQVAGKPGSQIFYRSLGPLAVAKIQRPKTLDLVSLKQFRKKHRTLTTYIEPGLTTILPAGKLGLSVEPFAHSCTSLIDLSGVTRKVLASFSQKTRYNIVHSLKKSEVKIDTVQLGQLTQQQLTDFFALHATWSKQKHVIGYSLSLMNGILKSFANYGDLHLCYHGTDLIGSLLVLYHDSVATYWAAFASPLGYRLYSPTLVTWQALQIAKERGCDIFDFGGIFDPRYPRMYKKWVGFTKFKSGFNPTVVAYPPTSLQLFW